MILQSRRESAMISAIMATAKKAKSGIKRKPAKRTPKKAAAKSRGFLPDECRLENLPPEAQDVRKRIEESGGMVVGSYCDPLGKNALLMAILPIDSIEPTPFQRDLSQTHHRRLADVIHRTGLFLDPVIAVTAPDEGFWTPNGRHRLEAMRRLGARSIAALVVPKREIAWQILALNTEKAHNLRDKSLEVIRIYRGLLFEDARTPGNRVRVLPRGSVAGHARHLLREERQVRRRRLQPDRAAARGIFGRAYFPGAQSAREARRYADGSRRACRRGHREVEGARFHEPVPARVRDRAH
jgi:hypothetical protein